MMTFLTESPDSVLDDDPADSPYLKILNDRVVLIENIEFSDCYRKTRINLQAFYL